MSLPRTFGELKREGYGPGAPVKDEMRRNLIRKLQAGEPLFPGLIGYDETVVPKVVNAILSRHNMILLGLRGQAKSRLLRSLTTLLDEAVPCVDGCELRSDPFQPLSAYARHLLADRGDETPIAWLEPEQRYVEKLATPDVTIADIIGDVDPIRAARGGHDLGDELTMHYGLLPRAHRGIFALNELPDLAGRIQVGLFNILQEGDVQIKGYPVRLNVDLCMVFSANPEDYTARGKIITPLKDRIGSEIRTHYPSSVELGVEITRQESWTERGGELILPDHIREVVEGVAFAARHDKKIDRRSGVSQRLPITALENAVSNAERRALLGGERPTVPRVSDVYAALPSLTGKLELEYEGELVGAEKLGKELIRSAVAECFSLRFRSAELQPIVDWFENGGSVKLQEDAPSTRLLEELGGVPGLIDQLELLKVGPDAPVPLRASAAEFVLEGLYAQKRIGRSDDRGFVGLEKRPEVDIDLEQLERLRRLKKQVN